MDNLGDYLKDLENKSEPRPLDAYNNCIYIRLDGRAFSKMLAGQNKPSKVFTDAMYDVTCQLVQKFNPDVAYVQSDEISLGWYPITQPSEFMFSARVNKLCSIFASVTTSLFKEEPTVWSKNIISFDCRAMELSVEDLHKMIYWRYKDCVRNAIQMVGQQYFSSKDLHGVTTQGIDDKLAHRFGPNWKESYPLKFLYGTLILRKLVTRPLNEAEKKAIPEKYWPEMITRHDLWFYNEPFESLKQFNEHIEKVKVPISDSLAQV